MTISDTTKNINNLTDISVGGVHASGNLLQETKPIAVSTPTFSLEKIEEVLAKVQSFPDFYIFTNKLVETNTTINNSIKLNFIHADYLGSVSMMDLLKRVDALLEINLKTVTSIEDLQRFTLELLSKRSTKYKIQDLINERLINNKEIHAKATSIKKEIRNGGPQEITKKIHTIDSIIYSLLKSLKTTKSEEDKPLPQVKFADSKLSKSKDLQIEPLEARTSKFISKIMHEATLIKKGDDVLGKIKQLISISFSKINSSSEINNFVVELHFLAKTLRQLKIINLSDANLHLLVKETDVFAVMQALKDSKEEVDVCKKKSVLENLKKITAPESHPKIISELLNLFELSQINFPVEFSDEMLNLAFSFKGDHRWKTAVQFIGKRAEEGSLNALQILGKLCEKAQGKDLYFVHSILANHALKVVLSDFFKQLSVEKTALRAENIKAINSINATAFFIIKLQTLFGNTSETLSKLSEDFPEVGYKDFADFVAYKRKNKKIFDDLKNEQSTFIKGVSGLIKHLNGCIQDFIAGDKSKINEIHKLQSEIHTITVNNQWLFKRSLHYFSLLNDMREWSKEYESMLNGIEEFLMVFQNESSTWIPPKNSLGENLPSISTFGLENARKRVAFVEQISSLREELKKSITQFNDDTSPANLFNIGKLKNNIKKIKADHKILLLESIGQSSLINKRQQKEIDQEELEISNFQKIFNDSIDDWRIPRPDVSESSELSTFEEWQGLETKINALFEKNIKKRRNAFREQIDHLRGELELAVKNFDFWQTDTIQKIQTLKDQIQKVKEENKPLLLESEELFSLVCEYAPDDQEYQEAVADFPLFQRTFDELIEDWKLSIGNVTNEISMIIHLPSWAEFKEQVTASNNNLNQVMMKVRALENTLKEEISDLNKQEINKELDNLHREINNIYSLRQRLVKSKKELKPKEYFDDFINIMDHFLFLADEWMEQIPGEQNKIVEEFRNERIALFNLKFTDTPHRVSQKERQKTFTKQITSLHVELKNAIDKFEFFNPETIRLIKKLKNQIQKIKDDNKSLLTETIVDDHALSPLELNDPDFPAKLYLNSLICK